MILTKTKGSEVNDTEEAVDDLRLTTYDLSVIVESAGVEALSGCNCTGNRRVN
jgi:hypothetical protein